MPKAVSTGFIFGVLSLAACGSVASHKPDAQPAENCSVSCTADTDCTAGDTCSFGKCTNGPMCPCTAGEFISCSADNTSANVCNASGDGLDVQSCAHGCNATAGKCNVCDANSVACSTDNKALESCSADGQTLTSEDCALDCTGTSPAHCEHIVPAYMTTSCDDVAADDQLVISAATTLDTSMDAMCNGGILDPTEPANEVCVV